MSNNQSDKSTGDAVSSQDARKAAPGKEDWIGANLRKVYDEALSEPVPERFLDLLKEIDKRERGT